MALEDTLKDVPVLRTMLALEQFDQAQRLGKAREVLSALEATGKAAEMQGIPDINRLRRAHAGEAEFKVQDVQEMRDLQRRLPEILQRGNPAETEAALARLAPAQYVAGQFRSPTEGLGDLGTLQYRRQLLQRQFEATQNPVYQKMLDEVNGKIKLMTTSKREQQIESLMETMPGISREQAVRVADRIDEIKVLPTGGIAIVNRLSGQPSVGAVATSVEGNAGGQTPPVSPYTTPPDPAGVRTLVQGTKPQERLNQDTKELTDLLAKHSIPTLDEASQGMEGMFKKYPAGDIPGIGFGLSARVMNPVYGAMTAMGSASSKEAEQNRAKVATWMQNILRLSAGLSQTASEAARTLDSTLSSGTASEAAKREAYNDWRHAYEAAKSSMFAGYAPEVVRNYFKQKGLPARLWAPTEEAAAAIGRGFESRGIASPSGAEGTAEYSIEVGAGKNYGASEARKEPELGRRVPRRRRAADFDK